MSRGLTWALIVSAFAATTVQAQLPYTSDQIPTRRSLARIGLDLQWVTTVPLGSKGEQIQLINHDKEYLFAQTGQGSLHTYNAETGRKLWSIHLGDMTGREVAVGANSKSIFAANFETLFGLDKATGRPIWKLPLPSAISSAINADEDRVVFGLETGKVMVVDARTGRISWELQSARSELTSRPIVSQKVVAFGDADGRVVSSRAEMPQILWRLVVGGPVVAPVGTHGVRTLLVPSLDKNLYAIDLFLGELKWSYSSGAPIRQEPLVANNDVYILNELGEFTALDALTGSHEWTVPTNGGKLIGVTRSKVYLETRDDDLFVVERKTGQMVYSPREVRERAGLNLRGFKFNPLNRQDDRLHFATPSGLVVCLREIDQVTPWIHPDPNAKPFGYIPPEGYPDLMPKIPNANAGDTPPVSPPPPGDTTPPAEEPK